MNAMRIDWEKVRIKMIQKGIRSDAELTRGAKIHPNAFAHTGGFRSQTCDRIAHFLECDPRELITLEEVEPERTPSKAADAKLEKQAAARADVMVEADKGWANANHEAGRTGTRPHAPQ